MCLRICYNRLLVTLSFPFLLFSPSSFDSFFFISPYFNDPFEEANINTIYNGFVIYYPFCSYLILHKCDFVCAHLRAFGNVEPLTSYHSCQLPVARVDLYDFTYLPRHVLVSELRYKVQSLQEEEGGENEKKSFALFLTICTSIESVFKTWTMHWFYWFVTKSATEYWNICSLVCVESRICRFALAQY